MNVRAISCGVVLSIMFLMGCGSGGDIPNAAMSSSDKLRLLNDKAEKRGLASQAEYQAAVEAARLEELFDANVLTSAPTRTALRSRVDQFSAAIDRWEKQVAEDMKLTEIDLEALGLSRDETEAALKGFREARPEAQKLVRDTTELHRGLVARAHEILSLVESASPAQNEGGTLSFASQKAADRYNDLLEEIQQLAAREEQLLQ